MQTLNDTGTLRQHQAEWQRQGLKVGLVPTMGNLHDGHIRLVNEARNNCDIVVTTIFVNPMQFGANEDLSAYPRTPEQDSARLTAAGCDLLFMPAASLIYPDGLDQQTQVTVPGLSERHCGSSRPGHFTGVATVVSKLFNLIPADIAFFGRKDYQQLQIIRKLARDLCFPHKIIGINTVREADGLAMSSRNQYLDPNERALAPSLYETLQETAAAITSGERDYRTLEHRMAARLDASGFRTDYLNICHADSLAPARQHDRSLVILAAARLGKARLIDNIELCLS